MPPEGCVFAFFNRRVCQGSHVFIFILENSVIVETTVKLRQTSSDPGEHFTLWKGPNSNRQLPVYTISTEFTTLTFTSIDNTLHTAHNFYLIVTFTLMKRAPVIKAKLSVYIIWTVRYLN